MTKDYTLLRPFDLDKAKAGEAICYSYDATSREFIYERDGTIVIHDSNGFQINSTPDVSYRMAPLAWIEGKPVYRGDVLYLTGVAGSGKPYVVDKEINGAIWSDNGTWTRESSLTWTPPKKTREVKLLGWLTDMGSLVRIDEDRCAVWTKLWKRVPSEDRTVTVEE